METKVHIDRQAFDEDPARLTMRTMNLRTCTSCPPASLDWASGSFINTTMTITPQYHTVIGTECLGPSLIPIKAGSMQAPYK